MTEHTYFPDEYQWLQEQHSNLLFVCGDHYVKGDLPTGCDALIYTTVERFVEHFGEDDRVFIRAGAGDHMG